MKTEKRTIAKLLESKQSAELAVTELEKITTVLCNPAAKHYAELNRAILDATETKINPAHSLQKAQESLRDYIRAIQAIIDTTEVDWPNRH